MGDFSNSLGVKTAARPVRHRMQGRHVAIEPLSARAHGAALFGCLCGVANDSLWTYMADGPYADEAVFISALERKSASVDPLFFALIGRASGKAAGHAALMRIDAGNGVIEIGNIMLGASLARSIAATEAMYLFARYVFEELGCRRLEWKCNDMNAPSKRAAERLGFRFEGVFRQHMIVKGRNRDTAWFSMLDHEWPTLRRAFEAWLAPENFDENGRQKAPLRSFRPALT